jgi:V/A-type H+/Na+-transporting ATPase subunit F
MYKMAVIGESEAIFAFRSVGFEAFLTEREKANQALDNAFHSGKYAVIFISESLAEFLGDALDVYLKEPFPAITVLPMGPEKLDIGMDELKKISIKATGTDLVSKLK